MASPVVTRPPATLPADFNGWDKPSGPPKTLPADFSGWDKPSAPSDPNRPAGLPAGMDLPILAAHPAVNMQAPRSPYLDTASPANVNAANVLKGIVKSVPGTLSGIAKILPGTTDVTDPLNAAAQTHGTAQAIGKGIGNAAQFLIPGGAEEKGAAYAASKLPMLGEAAAPIAKLATSAIGSGTVNKAQGGSFLGGAGAGAAGAGIGLGLKAMAPGIAETALKMRAADRAYKATPGRAILDETVGIKPSAVADSARERLTALNDEATDLAKASPLPVDLGPTRLGALDSLNEATARGHKGTIKDIGELNNQITTNYPDGSAIPAQVPALRAVQLKRGLGDLQTFNPTVRSSFGDAAVGNAYHNLGQSIEGVIPDIGPLNKRMQSLIPVVKRGTAADLNAGILQRLSGRMTAHTGALLGGVAGYNAYGIPGAVAGAVVPEILGSPEFQMGAARLANSPITRKALPALAGGGLQLIPNKQ